MRAYLLLLVVAAATTYLLTPVARRLAFSWGAITAVRARDVHHEPTPRLGGLAMLGGLLVAMLLASRLPFLRSVFENQRPIIGIVGGATVVCLLGIADDVWDLDWLTKLIGQVLAAGFLAWQGVLLYQMPLFGVTAWSSRVSIFLTVLSVVVAINAVNFVDGLDGLAAGVLAIGGTAFLAYSYLLTVGTSQDYASLTTLVLAILVGMCLGFLPHNTYPARIFMGDSGAMLIGLSMAAAAILVTGQLNSLVAGQAGPVEVTARQQFPAFLPLLLPVAVLLLPLLDMGLAVVRRVGTGKSPFHPDRRHLHHQLLQLGHTHRRAVLIMYLWTALFAFGGAALVWWTTERVLWTVGVGAVVALALTLGPLRGRARVRNGSAAS